jgi:hypothetical protein
MNTFEVKNGFKGANRPWHNFPLIIVQTKNHGKSRSGKNTHN